MSRGELERNAKPRGHPVDEGIAPGYRGATPVLGDLVAASVLLDGASLEVAPNWPLVTRTARAPMLTLSVGGTIHHSMAAAAVSSGIPVLTDWLQIVPAAIAALTVVAAATYYFLVLRQSLTTHQFDVLMRTVAVYHDEMSRKRSIAATFFLECLQGRRCQATPGEQLAIADIMRFFDTASWRAFTVFRLELGDCRIDVVCAHRHRRALQQRHEGVRAVVREVGLPAFVYFQALEACGQNDSSVVQEAALSSLTQFKRMTEAVAGFVPTLTGCDPIVSKVQARYGRGYYVDFFRRELVAPTLRP